jgi:hypothetical protein
LTKQMIAIDLVLRQLFGRGYLLDVGDHCDRRGQIR